MSRSRTKRRGYVIRLTLSTATKRHWHRVTRRLAKHLMWAARYDLDAVA